MHQILLGRPDTFLALRSFVGIRKAPDRIDNKGQARHARPVLRLIPGPLGLLTLVEKLQQPFETVAACRNSNSSTQLQKKNLRPSKKGAARRLPVVDYQSTVYDFN